MAPPSRPAKRPAAGGNEMARLLNKAREQQQQGQLNAAIKQLRKAIKMNPQDVRGYHLLAQIQQQQQRPQDSMQTYQACLRIHADDLEARINLGMLLKRSGQIDSAIKHYQKALRLRDDIPELHNNLGNALLDQGEYELAAGAYKRAVDLKPAFAGAWHNLGRCYLQQEQPEAALEPLRQAHRLDSGNWQMTSDLADCLIQLPLDQADESLEDDLLACLALQRIDGRALMRTACRYLRQQVFTNQLTALQSRQLSVDDSVLEQLQHPVLLTLLKREPLCDLPLETVLTEVRRRTLLDPELQTETALPLLGAMAEQCFLNEYLWEMTAAEDEALTQLRAAQGTASSSRSDTGLCLLACYQPLSNVLDAQQAESLTRQSTATLARVLQQQVIEPAEEALYRQRLPQLTSIDSATSQAVREQYEDNPYPRWRIIDEPTPQTLSDYLCQLFPHLRRQPPRFPASPAILCAGCGTGLQALRMARRIETADILALDMSRTSLAYGRRQARARGHDEIRFAQGDILQLDDKVGSFDCIECYGVLHHMADPEAGWRNLRRLLKPGGVMRIGLYSHAARGPIRQVRQMIEDLGLQPDHEGIRAIRRHIATLPADNPVSGLIHSPDFYNVSECRDLMFHVQEQQLDLNTIAVILERLELAFLGFEFEDFRILNRYRQEFPNDPDGLSLANWAEYEQQFPDSFAAQYIFWVRDNQ